MEQIFIKLLNMDIAAGYCVLVVFLLRFLLRKLPKIYSYVLWLAVFYRLACPLSIQSTFSLLKVRTQTIPQNIGLLPVPQIESGSVRADHVINHILRQTVPAAEPLQSVNPMQIIMALAAAVWLAGILVLSVYSAVSFVRLRLQLRGAVLLEKGIYKQEGIQTPFVLGVFRPRIYLPCFLEERDNLFILEHEKTHIRRKDYLAKQAAFIICCVHWFNPLVWLSFYFMCRDMEMSCDESVIKKLGRDARKDYSAALLSMASGKKIMLAGPPAFGEGGVRKRIANVLSYKKRAVWISGIAAAVAAAVTAGLLLNPREEIRAGKENPEDSIFAEPENLEDSTSEQLEDRNKMQPDEEDLRSVLYYKGYLDESPYQEWRDAYAYHDLDFDGMADRIYRDVMEDTVSYQVEFGNGDRLFLSESSSFFMIPKISSAKLSYSGTAAILFTGQHPESSDPLQAGETGLYVKLGDNYCKINLPQPKDGFPVDSIENRSGYDITESYDAQRNLMTVTVKSTGEKLIFKPDEDVEEGFFAESSLAFDAGFVDYHGEKCIVLYQNAGGKWRQDIVAFVLGIRPSERSDMQPFDLELLYAGWAEELEPEGVMLLE